MPHAILQAITQLRATYPPTPSEPFAKTLIGILVGTLFLATLFYLLERLFPEQPHQPTIREGTKIDAIYWFFDFFVAQRLVTALSIVTLIALVALKMPRLTLLAHQPLPLQALEALLVADFCGYWSHRMLHEIPLLWRLHKVHHSSEKLNWLAAARVHPLESAWNRLASLAPLFLLGFSPKITMFFGPLLGLYPIFIHCNVRWGYGWIGYVIASPAFHRWHHSADQDALNKNFSGLLPVFDFLFGTAHFPRTGKPARYGLGEERAPSSFIQQLWWPFRTRPVQIDSTGYGPPANLREW
jgi:sterol desaturase/sphingolipid hydroxylase (fatty acid hydroxylase superfamily)